jgi:hypothetical protein
MPVTISGSGAITGLVIGTTDLADAAVTTPKIADGAVVTVDIADGAVTLGKMANMATASVLGRNTAGTGAPEVLSAATTRTLIGADNASNLTTGTVPDARFPATLPAASGVNLTALNASNLGSGTVPTARLASGTANSTTYLRGDQTWATVTAGISAQNCSYTGTLVETGGFSLSGTASVTQDLGSNRVVTGLRRAYDEGSNSTFLYARGYNIKNTA